MTFFGLDALAGGTAVGENRFGDQIFSALDQIVNEMAKFRYALVIILQFSLPLQLSLFSF